MNKSEKFWNKAANQSDKQDNKMDQTYIKTVENTKKHLNSSDIVLDYACGTGTITLEIAGKVKEIHAIDITPKMIEVAKRKVGERKLENIHFAQSTIFDERYKKGSFDVVLAFNILHLLEDTEIVMHRINELLKPGGLFISATACLGEKNTFFGYFILLLSKIGLFPYLKILKNSEIENSIVDGDFLIVETEKLNPSTSNYFIVAKKI